MEIFNSHQFIAENENVESLCFLASITNYKTIQNSKNHGEVFLSNKNSKYSTYLYYDNFYTF